jgi:hypothetical protein
MICEQLHRQAALLYLMINMVILANIQEIISFKPTISTVLNEFNFDTVGGLYCKA